MMDHGPLVGHPNWVGCDTRVEGIWHGGNRAVSMMERRGVVGRRGGRVWRGGNRAESSMQTRV
jgi:hypothetical protein